MTRTTTVEPDARRVIVGAAGGIGCYKTAALTSRLCQDGASVRVVMTEAATRFVGPLTFRSLTGSPVTTSMWDAGASPESPHVELARWARLMVVAPATAHTIAKLAAGEAADALSLVALALPAETPLLIAPAMNAEMWANPLVRANVERLRDVRGARFVGPESGWQACRTEGAGRMSEPETIRDAVTELLPDARA